MQWGPLDNEIWKCLLSALGHYFLFLLIDVWTRSSLASAKTLAEKRDIWWRQTVAILIAAVGVYAWSGRIPGVLLLLACGSFLSSQGMTVLQGLMAILLYLSGFLQMIVPHVFTVLSVLWPWIEGVWLYINYIVRIILREQNLVPVPESHSLPPVNNYSLGNQPVNTWSPLVGNSNSPSTHSPTQDHQPTPSTSNHFATPSLDSLSNHPCPAGGQRSSVYSSNFYKATQPYTLQETNDQPFWENSITFGDLGYRLCEYICSGVPRLARQPRGLYNNGHNLCFMNSVLQCLARTPMFSTELGLSLANTEGVLTMCNRPERTLVIVMTSLLKDLVVTDGATLSQNKFRCLASRLKSNLIAPPESATHQPQQDAAEFLMWLLATVRTALNQQMLGGNWRSPSPNQDVASSLIMVNVVYSNQEITERVNSLKRQFIEQISSACGLHDPSLLSPLQNLSDLEWARYSAANQSLVDRKFTGQLAELHQCLACNRISVHIDTFTVLSVPVPVATARAITIEECLSMLNSIENLEGNNGLQCECRHLAPAQSPSDNASNTESEQEVVSTANFSLMPPPPSTCNLTQGQKKTILCRLPECLIIQLMRFRYDRIRCQCCKIHTPVIISSRSLHLSAFALTSSITRTQEAANLMYQYQIYGLCLHQGGENTTHGHYVAYAADPYRNWYRLEDEDVGKLFSIERELLTRSVEQNAYLLFYHLKT